MTHVKEIRFFKVGLSIMLYAFVSCSQSPEPIKEKTIPVQVVEFTTKDLPEYLQGHGILSPVAQAETRSQVSGKVIKIHYREGQTVQKGDLLAEIETTLYQLKLQEAEASLIQKQIQHQFAQKKLQRYLSVQKDHMAAIELDLLQQEIALHEANILADEARVKRAQIDVAYCSIYAPISGKIGKSNVQEESWVSVGTNFGTIRQIDALYVEFALTEKELSQVAEGTILDVQPTEELDSAYLISGTLLSFDNEIDSKSGSIQARGIINNPQQKLWPGQFVEWRLLLRVQKNLQFIPVQAIQQNGQANFVYVIDKDLTAQEREVKLGIAKEKEIIVLSGLMPDDKVVIRGQTRLYPGAKVEIFE